MSVLNKKYMPHQEQVRQYRIIQQHLAESDRLIERMRFSITVAAATGCIIGAILTGMAAFFMGVC